MHVRRRDRTSSDAYLLARASGVPAAVWLVGFALVIGAGTYWAVRCLTRIAGLG
ncbi:hypothetical protein GCM10027591_12940 [Zhihengliuella somnathii]